MLTRAREEDGFTLVELVVAMAVGMIVLGALLGLVDRALPASTRIANRVDAQQQGRVALAQIEQTLHSAVCLPTRTPGGQPTLSWPIQSMGSQQVTLYEDVLGTSDTPAPNRRQLVYDSASGTLVESTWVGSGTPPDRTWAATATSRVLLANVRPIDATTAVFAFYGYDPATGNLVATTDPTKVARVDVAFTAGAGTRASAATKQDATFTDSITVGLPTDFSSADTLTKGPQCLR